MHTIHDVKMIPFVPKGDSRGELVVIEGGADIPFAIQRIFYIYGSDSDVVRGNHANKKTQFVLVNVQGTSKVRVIDRNKNEQIFVLEKPNQGLYLPTGLWKEMYDFSADSVLLVLASEHYDPEEYIRSIEDYWR